jgi:hypothetical protein
MSYLPHPGVGSGHVRKVVTSREIAGAVLSKTGLPLRTDFIDPLSY